MQNLLTPREVAEKLQTHHQSVLKYISTGFQVGAIRVKLKASKLGSTYRIKQEDLDEFIRLSSKF